MKGFHGHPEMTRDALNDDGWLHTGDLGYCDAEGYLFVVDRSKKLARLRRLHCYDEELLRSAVEDIAARQEAADRLNLQSVLFDSVREPVISTDLQNNVIFWNKGAENLFGYSASEAIGKPVASLIMPDGATVITPEKTHALRTQGTWDAHVVRRRKDGSIIWTDLVVSIVKNASGERVGFLGIYRDQTEQRRVDQRLRFQAQLLDSVRESVVATDLNGCITFWGRGAETLFGYSRGEMVGQPFPPLTFPSTGNADAEFRRTRDIVLTEGAWNGRFLMARRKGSTFWADVTMAPVLDDGNQTVGLIAIHRDVSELKRNQELVKKSHERTRNLAARLMVVREHERSSIARELHDELGQALTRLNMDLCWLQQQLPARLRTERTMAMGRIVDGTLKTVQEISSQLRPPILDDLGLEAAVEWHVQEFAEWSGCRCHLDLRIAALPRDRDRDIGVFRILQEALTNVARHARAKTVKVRACIENGEFVLEVQDDGIGAPEAELASAHSFGISGMRERADGLGGQIQIVGVPRRGTTVTLRLGLDESAAHGDEHDSIADRR
jgi:two-component system sensor histidine kinase UhpB